MINRNTLIGLAAATFALLLAAQPWARTSGRAMPSCGLIGDIVWFGFLACALALIVLSVGVLVRSLTRSRRARSSSA